MKEETLMEGSQSSKWVNIDHLVKDAVEKVEGLDNQSQEISINSSLLFRKSRIKRICWH